MNFINDNIISDKKFIRRPDLTPSIRLRIACTALIAKTVGTWGTVSALARQYMISRTFVYLLVITLEQTSDILFDKKVYHCPENDSRVVLSYMLSLRLEGRCSINAISTIMERFGIDNASVGSISQYLTRLGALLPNTLSTEGNEIQYIVELSDEIFAHQCPILVTVDANSSAIMRIELSNSRKAEDWKRHWECLENNGYFAIYVVSDEGKGLCKAQQELMPEVARQSDTYHAIAHQFGQWENRLENRAYKAIEHEIHCYRILDSAKTEKVIIFRIIKYMEAENEVIKAIYVYDSFCFLYQCILEELRIFTETGELRNCIEAQDNIKAGLDLIATLGNDNLTDAVNKVRRTLPNLFHYFEVAKNVVDELKKLGIDQEALRALCLAWQWNKAKIKSKQSDRVRQCINNEQKYLEVAAGYLQERYDDIKDKVYNKLDEIVQSSALVECINSIIRPYLENSRNRITQETLNLIMFYHNHRRYKAGKRAGRTPMEVLTGKKQDKDWIELMLDLVEEKDPNFFS